MRESTKCLSACTCSALHIIVVKSLRAQGQLLGAYHPTWCWQQQDCEPSSLRFTSSIDRSLMSCISPFNQREHSAKISLGYAFAMTLDWPIRFELWKPGQEFKNVGGRFDFCFRTPLNLMPYNYNINWLVYPVLQRLFNYHIFFLKKVAPLKLLPYGRKFLREPIFVVDWRSMKIKFMK